MNSYLLKSLISENSEEITNDQLLSLFLQFVKESNIELYPAQEEAVLELCEGHNVILNTPTGSGKSLVATALHFLSISKKKKSFYTSPVKALVNEKFISLCYLFGPENVGLITGDATVNRDAPIICCTAEILSNMALRQGDQVPIHDVIIDEFHYYSDRERGTAWQIPLLTLPQCRFLLMSATMGDSSFFEKELTKLNQLDTKTVISHERPVPLDFRYQEIPLGFILENLVSIGRVPAYVVNFTQRETAEVTQSLMSQNFCTKEEKSKIAEVLKGEDFPTPYGKDIAKYLKHGIGIHHAGLLPRYRILVEKLAQKGLLKIIVGTDTLGVGVNVPIKTVILTKLCKFDGEKTTLLKSRDFHQICGRAGRKGFDDQGYIVCLAPEHIIENKANEEKAKKSQKNKKIVKVKPPEKNFIPWSKETFEKMVDSPPEPLKSSFNVNHGMILSVLSREEDGCQALRKILNNCHESERRKKQLKSKTFELFRSLVERKIIEFNKGNQGGNKLRLNLDLQKEFSLNQTLSLFLIDTIESFDPYIEDYAFKVLTFAESIAENPNIVLIKQTDRAKRELLSELKSQGVEYEKRMELLEEVTYPKPMSEFIYENFNRFSQIHPWVGQENIRPKSIVREMFEEFLNFNDYIKEYNLERFEGVLLRYLTEVYKILTQTIPIKLKSEELEEITLFLKEAIKSTDSSLIDEWEKMKAPSLYQETKEQNRLEEEKKREEFGILYDENEFRNKAKNKIYQLLKYLSFDKLEEALTIINNREEWPIEKLDPILDDYFDEHESISIEVKSRNKKFTQFSKREGEILEIRQTIVDDDELNDWEIICHIDLLRCKEVQEIELNLFKLGPI